MTAAVVWITGLPSSGKSTLAELVAEKLRIEGYPVVVLDGDRIRACLVPRLGYQATDRANFYSTLANLAAALEQQGLLVIVPATAHARAFREVARSQARRFLEVYVKVSNEVVQARDAKGLYADSRLKLVDSVPGADVAYEEPLFPDVIAEGGRDPAAVSRIVELASSP